MSERERERSKFQLVEHSNVIGEDEDGCCEVAIPEGGWKVKERYQKGGAEEFNTTCALFFDDEDARDGRENPDILAMQSIMYEESTVEERADNWKNQGNECLKRGKKYYKDALVYYSKALDEKIPDKKKNSIYLSNRSHVQFLLGTNSIRLLCQHPRAFSGLERYRAFRAENYGKAFDDAVESFRRDPKNIKSYYRGAKAAIHLEKYEEACLFCAKGLEQDQTNKELTQLMLIANKKDKDKRAKEQEDSEREQWADCIVSAISHRKLRVGSGHWRVEEAPPFVDEQGALHWPVNMVYGEVMSVDVIQDFNENHTFGAHLDQMFSPSAEPLGWDVRCSYRRDSVEVYFLWDVGLYPMSPDGIREQLLFGESAIGKRRQGNEDIDIEDKASKTSEAQANFAAVLRRKGRRGGSGWIKVREDATLKEVLGQELCVIPGTPVFYIVARDSEFYDSFLDDWRPPYATPVD
eukprot:scaffold6454_cov229-Prasinococcus_capsulatus_cf.AAC.3